MKIILSLAVVIVSAFLTHHFFISKLDNSGKELGREVAAFSQRNNADQVKWEQKIAEDLSSSKQGVQAAVKPNWQDQLAYEFFSGQYDISTESGRIQKITLQNSMNGVSFSSEEFLNKFGHQLKDFTNYKKNQIDSKTESINLYDKTGSETGVFHIIRNDEGHVVEMIIK